MFLSGSSIFHIENIDEYNFEDGDVLKILNHDIPILGRIVRSKAKCHLYENHPLLEILTDNEEIGWVVIEDEEHMPAIDFFAKEDYDVIEVFTDKKYYYIENGDCFEHCPQYNTKLGRLL